MSVVFDCFVLVDNSECHHDVHMARHEDGEQTSRAAHILLQLLHWSLQPDLQSSRAPDEEMSDQHGKDTKHPGWPSVGWWVNCDKL